MTTTAPGSLRVVPKDPGHFPGDGNDSTTTRWMKAQSMGIDLHLPRPHPHRKLRGLIAGAVLGVGVWILLGGIAIMVYRMLT